MAARSLKRILCIDDDAHIRDLMVATLQSTYPEVSGACDECAIETAVAIRPDLIILDVVMPIIDGITLFRMIKDHDDLCDIPIVFITSTCDDVMMDKYVNLGAIGVIPKPFRIDRLPCAIGIIWSHHQSSVRQFLYNLLSHHPHH